MCSSNVVLPLPYIILVNHLCTQGEPLTKNPERSVTGNGLLLALFTSDAESSLALFCSDSLREAVCCFAAILREVLFVIEMSG